MTSFSRRDAQLLYAAIVAGAMFTAAAYAEAQETPDPRQVTITSVTYGGTGCPQGTASSSLSPDATSLSVIFDQFHVAAGSKHGLPQLDQKACDVRLGLSIPSGWSVSLFKADFRGFVSIEKKASASMGVYYHFDNQPNPGWFEIENIGGPREGDFTSSKAIPFEAISWSGCDTAQSALTISSGITAYEGDFGNARSELTIDSLDGKFKTLYGLKWRRCATPGARETIPLYRFQSGTGKSKNDRGWMITADVAEGQRERDVKYQGEVFRVYRTQDDADMVPIYRCRNNDYHLGFVSRDPNCEDNRIVGQYGYVYANPKPGHVALHRFTGKVNFYHQLTTTNPGEGYALGLNYQGIIGYAPAAGGGTPEPTYTPPPTPAPTVRPLPPGTALGRMTFSGQVDIGARITWQGSSATVSYPQGGTLYGASANVSGAPLPTDMDTTVMLEPAGRSDKLNRGSYAVIQQPNASNGYTAIIQITDPKGGAGRYEFAASWRTR